MDLRPLGNAGMSIEARFQDFQDPSVELKPVDPGGSRRKRGKEVGSATYTYDADTTGGAPESVCRIRKTSSPSGIDLGSATRIRARLRNGCCCALVNYHLASPDVPQDQHAA